MDLKAFVTTALTDVLEGVKAAKEKHQGQVEPAQPSGGLAGGTVQRTVTVSFDLCVTDSGNGQKIILDSNSSGSSRLKFDVNVTF